MSERLLAEDVLHWLKIQEGFQDEYCANLDEESSNEDASEEDFTTSDGQKLLIDCDMLMGNGFVIPSELSTPAERD